MKNKKQLRRGAVSLPQNVEFSSPASALAALFERIVEKYRMESKPVSPELERTADRLTAQVLVTSAFPEIKEQVA